MAEETKQYIARLVAPEGEPIPETIIGPASYLELTGYLVSEQGFTGISAKIFERDRPSYVTMLGDDDKPLARLPQATKIWAAIEPLNSLDKVKVTDSSDF